MIKKNPKIESVNLDRIKKKTKEKDLKEMKKTRINK